MIKRQFFHMVTHVFGNSNHSQEIFAIDTWGAVIYSLGHGRKHMLYDPSDYMETKLEVSSQSRKFEFRVFSIVHLNIDNF